MSYLHRCWVVAREKKGQLLALTQTEYPKLAAIRPQLQPTADGKIELHITAPDMSPIIVSEELPPSASTAIVRYSRPSLICTSSIRPLGLSGLGNDCSI